MKLPFLPLTDADRDFIGRMAEQVAVTFGAAFVSSFGATGGSLDKASVAAAVASGLRAVYGYIVRWKGSSPNDPNVL